MILRVVWLLTIGLLVCMPAWAQPSAVDLAKEAKGHYDQGEWTEALGLFEQAEVLAHSPVLVLYAARCQRNLGKLMRAKELFEKVVSDALPANASAPFRNAQRDAKVDLEALHTRIPKIAIDRSRAPANWIVVIDGLATTAQNLQVDPGTHVVSAKDAGVEQFREEVTVAENTMVTVTILDTTKTPSPSPASVPDPEVGTQGDSDSAAGLAPGLALVGMGAAGLAVGIALRVMAVQKVEDVKDRCLEGSCLREDKAVIDEAVTFQTVSTVLFIVGGTAAATGIVLLIVLPGDEEPSVSLDVRPGFVALRGAF